MPERTLLHAVAALLAMASCAGSTEPPAGAAATGLVVLAVTARPVAAPAGQTVASERWGIVEMRANEPTAFMREGGQLALVMLHAADIELRGSTVIVSMLGKQRGSGVIERSNAGSRIVFPGGDLLEGELGPETAGKRQITNAWATITLEHWVEQDPRRKLCTRAGEGPLRLLSTLTRRAACEADEQEVAPDGRPVAATP